MDDLGFLDTFAKTLHSRFDFTQGARDIEVEALRQSVAKLTGLSTDAKLSSVRGVSSTTSA